MNTTIRLSAVRRCGKCILAILLIALVTVTSTLSVFAASYPSPTDYVADTASVLSEATVGTVKNANTHLAETVGITIAVCTVPTTGEESIADYARAVFKEWKMGEGVLLVIASEDKNYYFLQSSSLESVLTNDVITEIRDKYLEEDFASGNIDTGVMKVVAKLSNYLSTAMPQISADDGSEPTGTRIGSIIVGFFKFLLWLVIIAVVLFVGLFVVALFNDDVALFMNRTIFRRGAKRQQYRPQNEPLSPYQSGAYVSQKGLGTHSETRTRNPYDKQYPDYNRNRRG